MPGITFHPWKHKATSSRFSDQVAIATGAQIRLPEVGGGASTLTGMAATFMDLILMGFLGVQDVD